MKYDTLLPEDIEPYLNGRSWEGLKVGDEIAFPEPDGSAPTGESLVGLTCYFHSPRNFSETKEATFISFDAKTGMHTMSMEGESQELKLRELRDKAKSAFTFEGSDAYFASSADPDPTMLGLCTIGELGV